MGALGRGLALVLGVGGLAVLPASPADADAGVLDTAYGKGGIATATWAPDYTAGRAAAVQADGKVVVVGQHGVPAADGSEWAIVRLTDGGEPDDEFGDHGFVGQHFDSFVNRTSIAQGVMIDGEGRIVVAGYGQREGASHGFVVRYLTTGELDPGFGVDGVVDLGERYFPTSVAPRPDLGVAVAGGYLPEPSSPAFQSRVDALTSDGEPDASFSDDGTALFDLSQDDARDSEPHALIAHEDGSLVFAGNAGVDGGGDGFMVGFVDPKGGLTASRVHPVGDGRSASARALAEGPDGTVVLAGQARDAGSDTDLVAVTRYTDDAVLDSAWAEGGILVDQLVEKKPGRAYGVAVGRDGQVLVGGTTGGTFALARYDKAGQRDPGFGQNGVVEAPVDGADPRAMVVLRTPDTAVLAGTVGTQIGAARFRGALGSVEGPTVPSASVADTSVTEGTGGSTNATITVTLSSSPAGPVSVAWATSAGSATAGDDYTTSTGTASLAAGQTSTTFAVPVVPDAVDEPDETFTVTLSSPSGATLGDATATVTIVDDDVAAPPTTVSIQDAAAVDEGGTLSFPVVLDQASSGTITVDVATADGSATQPSDYTAKTQTLTFPPGTTSQDFTVTTKSDALTEGDEQVQATITGTTGPVAVDDPAAVGTIHNAGLPAASVGTPATVDEGAPLRFPVSISKPWFVETRVRLSTVAVTATPGLDYTERLLQEVVIPPGQTSAFFDVSTIDDILQEPDETVKVEIRGGTNISLGSPTSAIGTIHSTDPPLPAASVGTPTTVDEGAALRFPVTISRPLNVESRVRLSTVAGTATEGADYTPRLFQDVVIPPGQTTAFFDVQTIDDPLVEPDETVKVEIRGGTNISLGSPTTATGTIHSTDIPPPAASVGTPTAVEEGATLKFPVTLSRAINVESRVRLSTVNGTASAPDDYTARSLQEVVIPAGQTTAFFTVDTATDKLVEGDETVKVEIRGGTNISLGSPASAVGTIRDPATGPQLNEHVLLGTISGTVLYRVPGNPEWVRLDHVTPLPVGTLLDTGGGSVVVKYAVPGATRSGAPRVQSVKVAGGAAKLAQRRGLPGLSLQGKGSRHLTVSSRGRVTALGRYAVATLREGRLTVADRSGSTKVTVRKGVADAAPARHPKQVRVLRAGQSAVFRG